MHLHNIAHEPEPYYPFDADLNTTGLRADWRLADGTLVEAFGMLGTAHYDKRVERKTALAERYALQMVVLTPEDLGHLPQLLQAWMNAASA